MLLDILKMAVAVALLATACLLLTWYPVYWLPVLVVLGLAYWAHN